MNNFAAYVDLDVHKDTITVAIAAAKRSGKVRSLRAQTRSVQTAFKKQKNQRSIPKRINFAQDIPIHNPTRALITENIHKTLDVISWGIQNLPQWRIPEVGRGLANTGWVPCMLTMSPPLQTWFSAFSFVFKSGLVRVCTEVSQTIRFQKSYRVILVHKCIQQQSNCKNCQTQIGAQHSWNSQKWVGYIKCKTNCMCQSSICKNWTDQE